MLLAHLWVLRKTTLSRGEQPAWARAAAGGMLIVPKNSPYKTKAAAAAATNIIRAQRKVTGPALLVQQGSSIFEGRGLSVESVLRTGFSHLQ